LSREKGKVRKVQSLQDLVLIENHERNSPVSMGFHMNISAKKRLPTLPRWEDSGPPHSGAAMGQVLTEACPFTEEPLPVATRCLRESSEARFICLLLTSGGISNGLRGPQNHRAVDQEAELVSLMLCGHFTPGS
jgi:hypothetical protein